MRLEVRCCCDAHLIGWLPLSHTPIPGRAYVFVLDGKWPATYEGHGESLRTIETLTLTCEEVERDWRLWLALKSRDYPLEQLRRIHGFTEASPDDLERELYPDADRFTGLTVRYTQDTVKPGETR